LGRLWAWDCCSQRCVYLEYFAWFICFFKKIDAVEGGAEQFRIVKLAVIVKSEALATGSSSSSSSSSSGEDEVLTKVNYEAVEQQKAVSFAKAESIIKKFEEASSRNVQELFEQLSKTYDVFFSSLGHAQTNLLIYHYLDKSVDGMD
jgi:hypothetical protein